MILCQSLIPVVGLILSLFQLLMSVIGTIIALQIKPWKQVEVSTCSWLFVLIPIQVRVRTSYDRFRSLKLSCGCGGEIAINRHVASATAVSASHAKVNPSFKVPYNYDSKLNQPGSKSTSSSKFRFKPGGPGCSIESG